MAYVLGYLFADGSLELAPQNRGNYVRVSSVDRDRIVLIRSLLRSSHPIYKYKQRANTRAQYLLRIGSKEVCASLQELGLAANKSLTMRFPSVPPAYLSSFVLGYFDGDGGAYLDRDSARNVKRLLTVFTSGSREFLLELHRMLETHAHLDARQLTKHGSASHAFQMRYSTRDSLRLFLFLYPGTSQGLGMRRKYAIFAKYLALRRLSKGDLREVLDSKGPVAKKQRGGLQILYAGVRIPPGPLVRKSASRGGGTQTHSA